MKVYKVLLLGIGFFGEQWLGVIQRNSRCELVAVTGTKYEFENIENKYGKLNAKKYSDYVEAVDKTEADIVVIAIPTQYHPDAAKRALKKGIHVLCEKPLSLNLSDALDLVKFKSQFSERKFAVDQNYRWRPHAQTIKKLIKDGLIGEISSIKIEFNRPEFLVGYRAKLEMPLLQDVSIHHFDLLRYFTEQKCKDVFAVCYKDPWSKFEGKASVEAILEMENGIYVNYSGTWSGRGKETKWDGKFTFLGERGSLVLDENGGIFFYRYGNGIPEEISPISMRLTELDYCLDMLVQCIDDDKTPETNIEDNIYSYLMVCAAEKSYLTNSPVDLSSLLESNNK